MGKSRNNFRLIFFGSLAVFWLAACAPALETTKPPEFPRAEPVARKPFVKGEVIRIPMTVGDKNLSLEATLFKPEGPGPFPLLVLSHGTPRDQAQRRIRLRYPPQSRALVDMGFVVVVPMRRGYGNSEGGYAEVEGECEQARYYEAGRESAKDLWATVRYMGAQPYVNPHQVVLAGHSAGGFASLALASQGFDGLLGVISFAGGRGSRADQVCDPPALMAAFDKFGRTTRVPTLWIYTENDAYFGPSLVRNLHRAYTRAGGQARLVMLPPFSEEGHFLFPDVQGLSLWRGLVQSFVDSLGVSRPQ
jgi:dienelactone hydrolase